MNVIHKFLEFDLLFLETKGKETCADPKYVYHPYTYTLTKNWADMWDFANFVKSGWIDLKRLVFQSISDKMAINGTVSYEFHEAHFLGLHI